MKKLNLNKVRSPLVMGIFWLAVVIVVLWLAVEIAHTRI